MYFNNHQCHVIHIPDFVLFDAFTSNTHLKTCFFPERISSLMSEKKKAEEKEKELTMEIQKVKDTVIRLEKVSYSMD